MARLEELTHLMRELEDQLMICMKCGMCQSVCPLFDQTGRESDVARGKLALLEGLMQSMFDDPEGVYKRLNKCLLCGSCAANCPSGVGVLEIFLKARAILTGYMGLPAAKRLALRGILAHPILFDQVAEWGAKFGKVFSKPANEIVGTSCARVVSPLLQGRHFRTPAQTPFHREIPHLDEPAGRSGLRVALFTGCLIDKMFPGIARDTVRVLRHCGVGIYLPEGQGCCGIPAASSGDLTTFRKLLSHNIALFEKGVFDHMVTACGTCTSTIKEIWPMLAKDRARPSARKLAESTMDINAFLVRNNLIDALPQADAGSKDRKTVTYHDPCHLRKSLKIWTEPRTVLAANSRYRLSEMAEPEWCCGMGGSFNLEHYDISSDIGRRKAVQIRDTGASVLATGCPACMVQISDMLSQSDTHVSVRHPVELYAEGLYAQ